MKHLSTEQVEKFRARALNAHEFFEVDDHLAKCAECRAQFSDVGQLESLTKVLFNESIEDVDHLEFEQLAAYIDGTVDTSVQRSIEDHLKTCSLCSGEVEDLKVFRKSMPRLEQTQHEKVIQFARTKARWGWLSAIAAAIAIAAFGAVFWYQNRIVALQSKLNEVESQNAKLHQEIEQNRSKEASAIFRDGSSEVRIQKDGKVTALVSIPEAEQHAISKVVENQKFDVPPQVLKLIGTKETLMGNSDQLPFSLISPVGTAVATDHPAFRWEPLTSANGYQVKVFDSEFHSVVQSPWIHQTEWTPTQPLPVGVTLIWQVAARKQTEEVISPFAPFPDAKFMILSQNEIARVNGFRSKYSNFHLILGVQFAQLGLLDDAEIEFVALQQSNPNSAEAGRLLKYVRGLRNQSKDTESR